MKIQHILFSVSLIVSNVAVVTASETTDEENTKVKTVLLADSHTDGHGPATEAQPFWSKEQTRQAELEKKYKNKIAENAENKQAYAGLAGLYLTNNKIAEAVDAYQDAITHNPENPKLFAAISIAYLHQSKYAMAMAMADEALRLDPSMTQVAKINEYIIAKEAAIQAAANASPGDMRKQSATSGLAPKDAMHGSKNSVLQIDAPAK